MDSVKQEEELKYINQWKVYKTEGTTEARNEIVLQYTDLVRKIVLRFRGSYNNFGQLDDMVNQGMMALIDAVEKFDPEMGNKFETFASLKVKGAIIDFMRKQDWIPRNQRSLSKRLDEAYSELYTDKGCQPTEIEIAEKMGITVQQLHKIFQLRHNAIILSYEEMIQEKMVATTPLITNENKSSSPESELLDGELKDNLVKAINELNEKEKLVVSLYYYENLKLKEIADILKITESRVSQIHSASILKMKYKLMEYQGT